MRPFRLAPALISALLLHPHFSSIAHAQPAPADDADEAGAEEAPMDDADEAPPKPPSAPAAPSEAKPPAAPAPPPEEEEIPADEEMPSDAEMEAEMNKEMAAEAAAGAAILTKAPAKGKGAIVGVVRDTKFEESIIEAQVTVIGTKTKTFTDIEGRFRLELPPGTYNIRVSYELHQPTRVDTIVVKAGELSTVDASLVPDESAVETVEIVSDADKTTLEGQTLERKRSAAVGDGVGRAEIARTPDRNAAEAAQRVVGATIVGQRFVYVRGLGERYTNALLNGTPLPSPEPDRQTVPLDLFPSLVLDSITINKTFTPDMPGDFAGGSVRINTREFPRQTLFQVSLNGGFNTEATFKDRLSYQGSSTDWLGFDSGLRQMPDLPRKPLDPNRDEASDEELINYGKQINSRMSTKRSLTPPNHGISVVAGDSFKLGKEQKLGVVTALNWGRSYQLVHEDIRNFAAESNSAPHVADDLKAERGVASVRWGAFGSVSYEPQRDHRLNLTLFHSQSADDEAVELEGKFENSAGVFHTTHLQYISRALNFAQLRGTHTFPSTNRTEIAWHGAISEASRQQPDTRDLDYRRAPDGSGYTWSAGPLSPGHFFSDQSERSLNAGIDLTQPLTRSAEQETRLKLGGFASTRSRDFAARRFSLESQSRRPDPSLMDLSTCPGSTFQSSCSDKLFRADNVREGMLTLRENTIKFDEYEAGLDVYAGYAMIDSQVTKTIRAIGGARVEATKQKFVGFYPFDRENTEDRGDKESTDVLPALTLVFSPTSKANTRFSVTRTLARPQLREISPFTSFSFTGALPTQGSTDLEMTKITNVDMRFEFFPTLREVVAFSVFYKHFQDPIEEKILSGAQTGIISYANADSANLLGVELEGRKSLGFLTKVLDDFVLISNLTLGRSRVELTDKAAATNASRPLSYQSPYIFNVSLDYANAESGTDIRVLYNVFGKRIVVVGANGLDDVYEQPRKTLDLTVAQKIKKHFELKLSAQNILNVDAVFTHGKKKQAGDKNVTRRFTPGSIYTLTGTYTY